MLTRSEVSYSGTVTAHTVPLVDEVEGHQDHEQPQGHLLQESTPVFLLGLILVQFWQHLRFSFTFKF